MFRFLFEVKKDSTNTNWYSAIKWVRPDRFGALLIPRSCLQYFISLHYISTAALHELGAFILLYLTEWRHRHREVRELVRRTTACVLRKGVLEPVIWTHSSILSLGHVKSFFSCKLHNPARRKSRFLQSLKYLLWLSCCDKLKHKDKAWPHTPLQTEPGSPFLVLLHSSSQSPHHPNSLLELLTSCTCQIHLRLEALSNCSSSLSQSIPLKDISQMPSCHLPAWHPPKGFPLLFLREACCPHSLSLGCALVFTTSRAGPPLSTYLKLT